MCFLRTIFDNKNRNQSQVAILVVCRAQVFPSCCVFPSKFTSLLASAQRVGFFNIGSGRVLDKIPGSGSGSGQVGVSKNTIGYFRVSFLLSGIFGYYRVCQVFSGISGFTHIYILGVFSNI